MANKQIHELPAAGALLPGTAEGERWVLIGT